MANGSRIYVRDIKRMFDKLRAYTPPLAYFVTNEGGDEGISPVFDDDGEQTSILCGVPTWSVTEVA